MGSGDLVVDVFEALGELKVHGVAVKPGKPLVIAEAAKPPGRLMVGLPGYPMSALSDYYIFVRAWLRRSLGVTTPAAVTSATLARKHPSAIGRYEFLPVALEGDSAVPLTKGSSSISSLADADGFIEISENTEVLEAGSAVEVKLF